MSSSLQNALTVKGTPGLWEGLHGKVLTKISNRQILTSLGFGSYPQQKPHFDIEVLWSGAQETQTLSVAVEAAARPLNTGGYYWLLIVRINTDVALHQLEVLGGPRRLLNRRLVIAPTNQGWHAWLIPDSFDLHNRLVRDIIFCQDNDEDYRLVLIQIEYFAAAFKRI